LVKLRLVPLEVALSQERKREHDHLIDLFHKTKISTTNYQNKHFTQDELNSDEVQKRLDHADELLNENEGFACPIYIFEKLKYDNRTRRFYFYFIKKLSDPWFDSTFTRTIFLREGSLLLQYSRTKCLNAVHIKRPTYYFRKKKDECSAVDPLGMV
jgi:hypothetical protein